MSILRAFSFTCTHAALCHRDAFNHTCFYTEIFLHRDTFTQRCFCTGLLSHTEMIFLHTNTFTERWFYIGQTYTQMPKQTEALLQRNAFNICTRSFYLWAFLHRHTAAYYFLIFDGGHAYGAKEFSKHMQNHSFLRRVSWERVGPAQTHIAI